MAVKRVLDTNAALYILAGKVVEPLPDAEYFLSFVTEMELLSYAGLAEETTQQIRDLLADISLVINDDIKSAAIDLRRAYRLKLPDAIICATAMMLNAELVTHDAKLSIVKEIRTTRFQLK